MEIILIVVLGIVAWAQRNRSAELERKLDQLAREQAALRRSVDGIRDSSKAQVPSATAARADAAPEVAPSAAMTRAPEVVAPAVNAPPAGPDSATAPKVAPKTVAWTPRARPVPATPQEDPWPVRLVRDYFTSGNLVVRVGIIVLFFGVAFLLKYAAEHTQLSIQSRLIGVGIGALVLFVLGWRLRERRRGFALALQGGAIGVVYLTLFAALRLYALLSPEATFLLMAVLGVASCLLAVRQDSLALAMLGASGGFLAPILASTGEGSHVVLFSYYALLNVFIVVQAWFKAWRPLNLLAFVFTFAVGAAWGVLRYDPAQYASTQPFLVFFFLAFIAIAVLFAFRTAPKLTDYVDGTLVFGTPVIAMTLQMALVRDLEHGRAWSALAAGVIYLLLAAWLHQGQRDNLRLLKESFLAIGVALLTLAVPLWLDDNWTAATWALEGAALLWIGVRQQRWLASGSGVLLQLAAAFAFVGSDAAPAVWPLANATFVGALLLAVSALFSARIAAQAEFIVRHYGQMLANLLLAWGLCWWLYAAGREVQEFAPRSVQAGALLGLCALTAIVAGALARRLSWPALRVPALLILPLMWAVAAALLAAGLHPASEAGWLAWPAAFGAFWLSMRWHESSLRDDIVAPLHAAAALLLGLLVGWELSWQVAQVTLSGTVWAAAAWGLPLVVLLAALSSALVSRCWPLRGHPRFFQRELAGVLALLLLGWVLWLNGSQGDAAPLRYLPLLNPLDIAAALALLAVGAWLRLLWRGEEEIVAPEQQRWLIAILTAMIFVWLNAVLLRTMHHWRGVPYDLEAMASDTAVQASLSIFWTLLALGAMLWANRIGIRVVWFTGAVLMAAVVAKLFLVDLVSVGTVPRIVSFLVVGLLMLVIGYFSPLPPVRPAVPRSTH